MKQKNNKVQVKSNLKGVQKANNNKKQMKKPNPVAPLVTAPKNVNKKNKNLKVTPKSKPPKVIEEEEDDSESEEDSGADLEAEETTAGVVDKESDEDSSDEEKSEEQDVDDDDEEQDEENDNGEGSDDDDDRDGDDDDEPTEAPIEKNSLPKVGIPKIRTSEISKDYPLEKIIVVHNLPKKGEFKQIDLVEMFSKYGTIDTIKPVYQKNSSSSTAFISYTTAEAAAAALAADKMKVKSSTIRVSMKKENKREKIAEAKKKEFEEKQKLMETKKDCVIYVKNMKKETTEADVRKYFADCGDIEILTVVCKKGSAFAFVTFSEPESAQAALKLHHSTLNGKTIGVYMKGDEGHKDPQRTIFLKNLQHVDNFPVETLENIFGKFGEIEDIDIVCMKNILAFITFKNAASAKKALKLSGSTQDDLEIEIGQFQVATKTMNTVFMFNVKPGVEEKDICEFFANTGEIASIFIKTGFAIVKFKDSDGFCKSFLLNESELGGQSVFLEPYSEKKAALTKKHQNFDNRKRPFFNKNQSNKKQRMNNN